MQTRNEVLIDGKWRAAESRERIEVVSPVSEEPFAMVAAAGPADVDRAVEAARRAFDTGPFRQAPPEERAAALQRLSQALQKRGPEIAETIARENGAPIQSALGTQVLAATMVLDTYAEIARGFAFEAVRTGAMGQPVTVRRQPVGVCAAVIPWNVPLYIAAMKLGPALAAGCSVVLKPAPETPLDPYLLGDAILEAGIPPGVVNIVTAGREASEHLVSHLDVDKVSFTGSTATGARIGEICGRQIKRCTLELGGKSAAILLDDFDVDTSTEALLGAGLLNNGQACVAQTRLLVPRSRYAEIVDVLGESMRAMRVGDNLDPETQIGPLVARRQRDRALGLLERARADGARAVCGGGRPAHLDRGWFVDTTLLADVDNRMEIAREEVFGPVLVAIPYEGDDEAVKIANDSPYGLGGGVWSPDADRAAAIAARLRTGSVTLNHAMLLDFKSPFGGFKRSGIGRELGPEGVEAYVEYQSVIGAIA